MSIKRRNVYDYHCDHKGCQATVEQPDREVPDGWMEWSGGEDLIHVCKAHAGALVGK